MVGVDVHEVDVKVVGSLGVGHAKIQAQLVMLKRESQGLEVRKDADQRFFLGEAVFDDRVAHQERLNGRRGHVNGVPQRFSTQHRSPAASLKYITEQRLSGPHSAEVRGDFDELPAV